MTTIRSTINGDNGVDDEWSESEASKMFKSAFLANAFVDRKKIESTKKKKFDKQIRMRGLTQDIFRSHFIKNLESHRQTDFVCRFFSFSFLFTFTSQLRQSTSSLSFIRPRATKTKRRKKCFHWTVGIRKLTMKTTLQKRIPFALLVDQKQTMGSSSSLFELNCVTNDKRQFRAENGEIVFYFVFFLSFAQSFSMPMLRARLCLTTTGKFHISPLRRWNEKEKKKQRSTEATATSANFPFETAPNSPLHHDKPNKQKTFSRNENHEYKFYV